MHTIRVIPCLDVNNGRVVKGVNFVNLRDAGDPVEIAKAYDKAGADEVVFLDITASSDGRDTVVDMVRKVAEQVFALFNKTGVNEKSDSKDIARPEDLKQVQTDAPRIEQKLKWYDKFELWENLIADKFLEFFGLEDEKYRTLREKKFIVASSISILLVTLPFLPFMLIGKYLFDSDVPYIQWFVSGVICKLFKIDPEREAAKNPEKFEKTKKTKSCRQKCYTKNSLWTSWFVMRRNNVSCFICIL